MGCKMGFKMGVKPRTWQNFATSEPPWPSNTPKTPENRARNEARNEAQKKKRSTEVTGRKDGENPRETGEMCVFLTERSRAFLTLDIELWRGCTRGYAPESSSPSTSVSVTCASSIVLRQPCERPPPRRDSVEERSGERVGGVTAGGEQRAAAGDTEALLLKAAAARTCMDDAPHRMVAEALTPQVDSLVVTGVER